MGKYILIILLINELILLIGFLFVILISAILSRKITHPHLLTREEHRKIFIKQCTTVDESMLKRIEKNFTLSDGYIIHGDISMNDVPSNKYVIVLHGHGTTREGAVRYAIPFYNLGYNIILYDQRGHGDNKKHDITMGYLEAQDLVEIIEMLYKEYGDDIEIGVHGTSMGAATALIATKYTKQLKFIVSDSCYYSLKSIMSELVHKYVKGAFLFVPYIDMFLRNHHHFTFSDVEPYKAIKETNIPILFFHGAKDVFVKENNVHRLYDCCNSYKEKWIFADSGHGNCIIHQNERYAKIIADFLNKIEKEPIL